MSSHPTHESIEQFIATLPKAELHIHLEGCVDSDTLWELAVRQDSPLVAEGRAALDKPYGPHAFTTFMELFSRAARHLQTPEDYELVAYRTLRRLSEQNVRYAELTVGAGVIQRRGQNLFAVFEGIEAGAEQAREECGIQVQWILDAVRNWGTEPAWPAVRAAAALRSRGVVAFGLGGDEARGPASQFREVFAFARSQGLRLHAHAGELGGPESVWSALNDLGAERIGHGLAAIQDAALVEHLARTQVPVELCPTSNWRTGGIPEIGKHPLRQLFDRGVQVSLHSDDPAFFGTDINGEYLLAHRLFGFTREELTQLARNSFQAAFLPEVDKKAYLAAVDEHAARHLRMPQLPAADLATANQPPLHH